MSRVPLNETIFRSTSPVQIAKGVSVEVLFRGTAEQATLYSSETGASTLSQPLTTGSNGKPLGSGGATAWLEAGAYDLKVNGQTYQWEASKGEAQVSFNVKSHGAKGNGATDDATAIQAALNACAAAGGGVVFLPPGTYIVGTTLLMQSNVTLMGAGWGATILKLKANAKQPVLSCQGYGTTSIVSPSLLDLQVNGNLAENVGYTGNTVQIDAANPAMERVWIKNGYVNLASKMTTVESSGARPEDGVFNDIRLFDSKAINFLFEGPHDSQIYNVLARTNEGINFSIKELSIWLACHGYGNAKWCYEIAAGAEFVHCIAEGAKEGQVILNNTGIRWRGGRVFNGGGEDGKIGFVFGSEAGKNAFSTRITDVEVEGCINGAFKFNTSNTANSLVAAYCTGASGKVIAGTPDTGVDLREIVASGGIENNAVKRTIASSGFVPAPQAQIAEYTGTAEINTLQFGRTGQELTVYLPSTAKLVTSGNIADALTGPGSQRYIFDGAKWRKS